MTRPAHGDDPEVRGLVDDCHRRLRHARRGEACAERRGRSVTDCTEGSASSRRTTASPSSATRLVPRVSSRACRTACAHVLRARPRPRRLGARTPASPALRGRGARAAATTQAPTSDSTAPAAPQSAGTLRERASARAGCRATPDSSAPRRAVLPDGRDLDRAEELHLGLERDAELLARPPRALRRSAPPRPRTSPRRRSR